MPLVVGELPPEARAVITAAAAEAGAPLVEAAQVEGDVSMSRGVATVSYRGARGVYPAVRLALAGRHQVANAATALRVLEIVDREGGWPLGPTRSSPASPARDGRPGWNGCARPAAMC